MPRLLLDTNLLLVFIVGSVDPGLLGSAKRLKEYRADDYEVVVTYVSLFHEVVLLPNLVTETSNFLGQMKGERRTLCMTLLRELSTNSPELYVRSGLAVIQPEYLNLGVTDASILCVLDEDTYLLTADFTLYLAAVSRNRNAQYFDELRP